MDNSETDEHFDENVYIVDKENIEEFSNQITNMFKNFSEFLDKMEDKDIFNIINNISVLKDCGFVESEGELEFTEKCIDKLFDRVLNDSISSALIELSKDGLVDILWDENESDFVYKVTKAGKDLADDLYNNTKDE